MAENQTDGFRVLAINGSPRAGEGMTDIAVKRFLAGAESTGASTEVIYPAKMKIAPCQGCLNCWFKTPGVCRHRDDMQSLAERMGKADLVVFASPVYVDGMTSQMKKMFDRLVSFAEPFFMFEGKRTYHPGRVSRPVRSVVISVCGFPEREHFQAISLHFKRIFQNMHAELLGEFYFPASSIFVSNPPVVASQFEALERAGREAVENGQISAETIEAANRDYVEDPGAFGEQINELFHNLRRYYKAE
ncbi:MAG: flavodoxin family protein [Actinobacteria bacterium]|nr:flavodoxin family protein [Actinomycetota bacterium]